MFILIAFIIDFGAGMALEELKMLTIISSVVISISCLIDLLQHRNSERETNNEVPVRPMPFPFEDLLSFVLP